MLFRLQYLHHDFELPSGRFLIGRSAECQLSLDDPLVSRKHAILVVEDDRVELQDLGSRNGVLVNGERIDNVRPLQHGDQLSIGSQKMLFRVCEDVNASLRVRDAKTLGSISVSAANAPPQAGPDPLDVPTEMGNEPGTGKRDALRLLGGVADKALALGRADEAERLLSSVLDHLLHTAEGGTTLDPQIAAEASRFAARLAAATGKARWVDYVFELYSLLGRPCPGPVIDELHPVLRKVKDINVDGLRTYVQSLRQAAAELGPADRFLLQRIESLERIVAP